MNTQADDNLQTGSGTRHASLTLLTIVLLSACQTPAPPMPAPTPPKPQVSFLNIPISIPLAVVAAAADKDMPRAAGVNSFEHKIAGGAQAPECGIEAGYSITRGPLGMSASGDAIRSTFDLEYWLQGRKQMPCPGNYVVASCGVEGEPLRTAKVSIETTIAVLPDFSTNVHSSLRSIVPGDRCVLNPVGLDITDNLMTAFQDALKPMLASMDARLVAELRLRQRIEAGWARMSEPAQLRPGIWLSLNPEGIGVVPLSIANGELLTGIQVRLRPVVDAGAQPQVQAKALPQGEVVAATDVFELQIPVEVEQSFVQARLDKALDLDGAGTTVSLGNYSTRVTGADVQGQGSQVEIHLEFKGDANGKAVLKGTPYYDAAADTLSFPDLDYTLDSDHFLLNSANAVAQGEIRDRLRTRFTIEMARPVDNLKQGLEKVLNGRRGNMQLHGQVQELNLVGVYRLPNGKVFTAYLAAKGTVSAVIEPQ
jgi:hypothetical protein